MINEQVTFCISRITTTFSGNRKYWGTGFWVAANGIVYFVTNRHNIDAKLKFGEGSKLSLLNVEVDGRTAISQETESVSVDIGGEEPFLMHSTADCVAIAVPEGHRFLRVGIDDIADSGYLARTVRLTDRVYFLGFAGVRIGREVDEWWDTEWSLPIAREASISSLPRLPFSNPLIITSDVTLVSGHSFAGASGSPVFHSDGRSQSKIVGLMSGHLINRNHAERPVHGGLSYFTRSDAIRSLLCQK